MAEIKCSWTVLKLMVQGNPVCLYTVNGDNEVKQALWYCPGGWLLYELSPAVPSATFCSWFDGSIPGHSRILVDSIK